ncbi:DNA primase [Salinarchaeum sp. Harcht-Bsk1]|uniref:DNA primase DnaG n=1 Tax=Salinarchaeum sp. Harcht-Bsk1 TaxID=1333523 RepID=UPI0003424316|nr:DNA primase DnaG [Salinarchaeum sp. Harcht-Bsk1]AGN01944.1 DNA primase [Salinarchaeum sp. Harcht-Bsk1]
MDNSAKYLIHAAFAADGIVERSDVVGAVYGQTEGLLGEELDIRRLQESSKLGRIDVEVQTASGQSAGEITIATSLDRVETATLAAALETIDRVGPCRATIEVTNLEDVRAATRRTVVDRAQELLLSEFEGATSDAIVEEVRRRVATADITTYEGLPAGPSVADGDAIVVVEGRADVKALLAAGVKNAIAVEGTDVPEIVADLSQERRTTAFLDGDRGGELILQELRQVGDVDAVAFAPADRSVEDLSRSEILAALRSTVDVAALGDAASASDLADAARARTSGGTAIETPGSDEQEPSADLETIEGEEANVAEADCTRPERAEPVGEDGDAIEAGTPADDGSAGASVDDVPEAGSERDEGSESEGSPPEDADEPRTIHDHVEAIQGTDDARFLDAEGVPLQTVAASDAFDALEAADHVPVRIVLDDALEQRLLDLAAQRGVREIVATDLGEFTKRPTDVRVRTAAALLGE